MAASVAVIQGSSKGIGKAFSQYLLKNTKLNVCATTQSGADTAKKAILEGIDGDAADRLSVFDLDVCREESIRDAAHAVEKKHGKNSLRMLINVSGILKQEKSILKLEEETMLQTYRINTFGHVLTYKHFVPLLPSAKSKSEEGEGKSSDDPASGIIQPGLSVLASMSARVGSIADNRQGGWYSYRASKTAINQVIKSLNCELGMRSSSACIALALHPGTVAGTALSEQVVGKDKAGTKKGVHTPEEAAEMLLKVIGQQGPKDGGRFLSYDGEEIPW